MTLPVLHEADRVANPLFADVWDHVTTQILEGDGASRRVKEHRINEWSRKESRRRAPTRGEASVCEDEHEHEQQKPLDFDEEVRKVRVRRMKTLILRVGLGDLAYLSSESGERGAASDMLVSKIPVMAARAEMQDITNVSAPAVEVKKTTTGGSSQRTGISGQLRDAIAIICAYLDTSPDDVSGRVLDAEEIDLVAKEVELFTTNISAVADTLSSYLVDLESSLFDLSTLSLSSGEPNPSKPLSLSESLQLQLSSLADLRTTTLPVSLTTLTSTVQTLLTLQRNVLHLQLQRLETSKHGVVSRHSASKMAFLNTVAKAMALKTRVRVLEARKEIETSPEAESRRNAMRDRMVVMREEEAKLDERIRVLEGVLGEYETLDDGGRRGSGIETMRKLGTRYGEIEGEMVRVRKDIEMLEARGRP